MIPPKGSRGSERTKAFTKHDPASSSWRAIRSLETTRGVAVAPAELLRALAAAGCPLIEVHEPAAIDIGGEELHLEMLRQRLDSLLKEKDRLLFHYFEFPDRVAHVFWRFRDPKHPAYDPTLAKKYGDAVEKSYETMDSIVGETVRALPAAAEERGGERRDENNGEGEVEYWLSRRVVVQGTVGDRNVNGVDLLWRKRY